MGVNSMSQGNKIDSRSWEDELEITNNADIQAIAVREIVNYLTCEYDPIEEQTIEDDVFVIGLVRVGENWRAILKSKTEPEQLFEVSHNHTLGVSSLNVYEQIDFTVF